MPNKTIYIADEDMAVFQKAQEIAGKSISKVIAEALREFVVRKTLEGTEFEEHEVWSGHRDHGLKIEKVRFIGKYICGVFDDDIKNEYATLTRLYKSRKGKFLVDERMLTFDEREEVAFRYEIAEDFNQLYSMGLPDKLIEEAEEKLGRGHIRFLDI